MQGTGAFPDLMQLYVSSNGIGSSVIDPAGSSSSTFAFNANRADSSSAFLTTTTAAADASTILTSSRSSSSVCGVPAGPMQPASKPGGPSLTHLRVVGEMTQAKVQQLVRLLDVLPGTHHLRHLVLGNVVPGELFGRGLLPSCRSSKPGLLTCPPSKIAAAIEAEEQGDFVHVASLRSSSSSSCGTHVSSRSTSSSGKDTVGTSSTSGSKGGGQLLGRAAPVGASTAAAGSCWRSSCRTLQASKHEPGDNLYLRPLLGALQQPHVVYLVGSGIAEGLLQCAASLQPLHNLHVHALQGGVGLDVVRAVAGLTGLRHLGITQSAIPDGAITAPASTALGHLSSLDFSASSITQHTLEQLVGLTGLRELVLTDCSNLRALPDSISRLVSLEALRLWRTQVRDLPQGMTALTGLRTLEWSSTNRWPHYLQLDVLLQLRSLRCLTLGDGERESMPDGLSQLTALTLLWLDTNNLMELPDSLSQLMGLQQLRVASTELHTLPVCLTTLTGLQLVDVPREQLENVSAGMVAFLDARKPGNNPG
jgi:hypothetical protein